MYGLTPISLFRGVFRTPVRHVLLTVLKHLRGYLTHDATLMAASAMVGSCASAMVGNLTAVIPCV